MLPKITNCINLVTVKNPFDIRQRELKTIQTSKKIYLKKFLEENIPGYQIEKFNVAINGRLFTPEDIGIKFVKPGDYVAVCPAIHGGARWF